MIERLTPYSKLALVSLGLSIIGMVALRTPFAYGGYDIARISAIAALPVSVAALIFTKGKLRLTSFLVAVIILLGWFGYTYLIDFMYLN